MGVSAVSAEKDALAPFPIYFAKGGKPTKKLVKVQGRWMMVGWDGAEMRIDYANPPGGKEPPKIWTTFDWSEDGGEWREAQRVELLVLLGALGIVMVVLLVVGWWLGWVTIT